MLDHRTGGELAQTLALQAEAIDQALQGGRQQVLVAVMGIDGIGTGKRNPVATQDGNPSYWSRGKAVFGHADFPSIRWPWCCVGAGLLAMAIYPSAICCLTHRYRQQAGSHKRQAVYSSEREHTTHMRLVAGRRTYFKDLVRPAGRCLP